MLAQVLPGFRDFRTPLVTGYLWLTVLWVSAQMPIPSTDETAGPVGLVNWLNGYTSSAALLAIMSFVAFLVGILLTVDTKQANMFMARYGFTRTTDEDGTYSHPRKFVMHRRYLPYRQSLPAETRYAIVSILDEALERLVARGVSRETLQRQNPHLEFDSKDPNEVKPQGVHERARMLLKEGFMQLVPALTGQLHDEIPVLATKLQEKNERLFETYDRFRSEAEFRMSVALPLFGLAVASGITWIVNANMLLGICAIIIGVVISAILIRKGWVKLQESSSVVITALEIGTIQSQVIERLDSLPGE